MLNLEANTRPLARELVEEFSSNQEKAAEGRPDNVQLYQEFQSVYKPPELHDNPTPKLSSSFAAFIIHRTRAVLMAAIERQSSNFWLWHVHSICARDDDLDGAIEACQREFERSPDNPAASMELMNLYATKGDYLEDVDFGIKLSWDVKPLTLHTVLSLSQDSLITAVVSDLLSK